MGHELFETGDVGAPREILDRNGEVVLGLCKHCGKAESELGSPCATPQAPARNDLAVRKPNGITTIIHVSEAETDAAVRQKLIDMGWTPPGAQQAPDFEAVRNKRMSELTPEQQEDAHELWLREQLGWMPEYHREHYQRLLGRLDKARAMLAAAAPQAPAVPDLSGALRIALETLDWYGAGHHDAYRCSSLDRVERDKLSAACFEIVAGGTREDRWVEQGKRAEETAQQIRAMLEAAPGAAAQPAPQAPAAPHSEAAEALLLKIVQSDEVLLHYVEKKAKLSGKSLREQIKGAFND